MPRLDRQPGADAVSPSRAASPEQIPEAPSPRPQRLHTWFNLIPVDEFESRRPERVLFLDTFVTVSADAGDVEQPYRVLFEGLHPMTVVVQIGIIFVWYGDELLRPGRPFPTLYRELYPTRYVTSKATIFNNTHIMDFVENGSDNLHFRIVHLWNHSKIYDHEVSDTTITLKQDTRFRYGSCSNSPFIRLMSRIIPELELTHDYVYHGPGLAVVGAKGRGAPNFHALVSLTPEGMHRTRVYVTMALDPATFPAWLERSARVLSVKNLFSRLAGVFGPANMKVSPGTALCDRLAGVMANYIKNEFDVDAVIWSNRKWMPSPRLIPSEKHLFDVIRWGETFYPPDHIPVVEEKKPEADKRWQVLDEAGNIGSERIHSYRVGGEALIAYRDSAGAVHVKNAYCPHQGAHLGFGGRLEKDCVRCPFHGFYFDVKGRCRGQNVDNAERELPDLVLDAPAFRARDGNIEVLV